jgi:hypothetical protein
MKVKFADVVSMINAAPSGSFVGVTNYVSEKGDVASFVGHIGFSYAKAKQMAIDALKEAILKCDFEPIVVSGNCYHDGTEFNSRKRSAPVKPYKMEFDKYQVQETAKEILNGWENPKERENNKVNLSEKENGLSFNTETGNFTFGLLVEKITYKDEASKLVKEEMGFSDKVEIKAPETKLKEEIRERFEKKFRTFTLSCGKFESVSIAGNRFASDEITF